jgi:hypothetical protein
VSYHICKSANIFSYLFQTYNNYWRKLSANWSLQCSWSKSRSFPNWSQVTIFVRMFAVLLLLTHHHHHHHHQTFVQILFDPKSFNLKISWTWIQIFPIMKVCGRIYFSRNKKLVQLQEFITITTPFLKLNFTVQSCVCLNAFYSVLWKQTLEKNRAKVSLQLPVSSHQHRSSLPLVHQNKHSGGEQNIHGASAALQRQPSCLASPIPRHYTSRLLFVRLC